MMEKMTINNYNRYYITEVRILFFSHTNIIDISYIIAKNIEINSLKFNTYKATLALQILNSISSYN